MGHPLACIKVIVVGFPLLAKLCEERAQGGDDITLLSDWACRCFAWRARGPGIGDRATPTRPDFGGGPRETDLAAPHLRLQLRTSALLHSERTVHHHAGDARNVGEFFPRLPPVPFI